MPHDRFGEPLTDSDVDREIEAALAVEPAADFLARVRVRIATGPGPSQSRGLWGPLAIGAIAATTALVCVVILPAVVRPARTDRRGPGQAALTARPLVGAAVLAAPPEVATRLGASVAARSAAAAIARASIAAPRAPVRPGLYRAIAAKKREPEVLVSKAEVKALRHLMTLLSQGRLDLAPTLFDVSEAGGELQPPPEIAIEPIKVDPLVPQSIGEGVRQ